MEWHQHVVVKKLSHLGQVLLWASHKKPHGSGRERVTFVDETIFVASSCFNFFLLSTYYNRTVVLKFGNFRGSLAHFYTLTEFSRHLRCIIQIWTTSTCSCAKKMEWKIKCVSLVACLGPMQEMGMNFKHLGTVACRQTLRYLVFKFQ